MHYIKNRVSILFLALVGACMQLQAQAPQYNVTVLPPIDQYKYIRAYGLNNLGEIVGEATNSLDYYALDSGIVYSNGTTIDLGPLIGSTYSLADGINDNGQIVGEFEPSYYPASYPLAIFPFIFSPSEGFKSLGSGMSGSAYAINNAGQVVGAIYGDDTNIMCLTSQCPAIFLQNGTIIPLSHPSDFGYATDINDYYTSNGIGQIVGYVASGYSAFLYENGMMMNELNAAICPPQYEDCVISFYSINDVGQIPGWFTVFGEYGGGFIYNSINESTYYFTEDAIYPNNINDDAWVVGVTHADRASQSPFLFINGTTYNLYNLIPPNLVPLNLEMNSLSPIAINNQGQIAANSNLGALLLTPIKAAP